MTTRKLSLLLALLAAITLCLAMIGQQVVSRAVYQTLTLTSAVENGAGQYDAALQHATLALKFNSQLAGAHGSRCVALSHLGRYDEAIQECSTAIELPPFGGQKSVTYSDRAEVYMHIGRYDLAVDDLSDAIRLNDFAYYHFLRGSALIELGFQDLARSDLLTAH